MTTGKNGQSRSISGEAPGPEISTTSGDKPCRVCDRIGPMAFRKDDWCSDDHRKIIKGEVMPGPRHMQQMQASLAREMRERWGQLCE